MTLKNRRSCIMVAAMLCCFISFMYTGDAAEPTPLKIVFDDNYPPYAFRDPTGKLQGILIDQWELWSRKTGRSIQLTAMDWDKAQAAMKNGEFDIIDTLFVNEERHQIYDFSRPYATIDVAIFFSRNVSGIEGLNTLKGFKVGVKSGDDAMNLLFLNNIHNAVFFDSYEAMIQAAKQKELVVFVMDKPPALYFLNKLGLQEEFNVSPPINSGQFHRAVKKGNAELLTAIEAGFAKISHAEYEAIEKRWFGEKLSKNELARWVFVVLAVAGIIMILLTVWSYGLKKAVGRRTAEVTAAHEELAAQVEELRHTQETLTESEERYRAVMEQAPEAVIICNPETGEILEANTRFIKQFGYDLRLDGTLLVQDLGADTHKNLDAVLVKARQNGFLHLQRRLLRHKNGTLMAIESSATMVHYRSRNLLVQTLRDVSEEVRREQNAHYQANHDELTGLYNRRGFAEVMAKSMAAGGALLLVDIDDFKLINDVHGHGVGDKYLTAFADYLCEQFGETAMVTRFGGDEFILFFAGPTGLHEATMASALMEVVCLDIEIGSFFVQLSGGISLFPEHGTNLEILIQRADLALHHAKQSGKWCCKLYESVMQDKVNRSHTLKEALGSALANNEFYLVFQPIFDIQEDRRKLIGYEALLRWDNPRLGVISPGEFIPIAEETNLILPIGKWVLSAACLFSVNLGKTYGDFVNVSVNISMRQLAMPNFVNMVKETLRDSGLPASYLSLEVTESILMTDASTRISYLQDLREVGVTITLDDFGTGYSSFTYLAQMPITTLKIDKSMVDEITVNGNRKSLLLLESLLKMSALLGYRAVAEGVETEQQLLFLKSKGCGYCQGYLLGRPMTEDAVLAMYRENH